MPPPYVYEYPRPALTVDLVLFAFDGEKVRVLLIRRKNEPFAGRWALPGGFVEIDEELRDAAVRELGEETGLHRVAVLAEIGTFAAVGRDPRGRTVSVAHAAVCRWPAPARAGDDASLAAWLAFDQARDLAFDHDQILTRALAWLRDAILEGPAGLALLPLIFDHGQVRRLFQAVDISARRASAWTDRLLAAGQIRPHPTQPGALRAAGHLSA
jgi:8-oxo-dGTP diphosphatase